MKPHLTFAVAALCLATPVALFAAETSPDTAKPAPEAKEAKRERHMRVIASGEGGPRAVRVFHGDEKDLPKEIVTFLGVQTIPVDPALNAQLGLKRGMGLTVREVVEASPASAVLKEHDVLTKLNDQWLVTQHQLSVLIQSYNEGDEVSLTFVRGGKEQSAKVKLGKKERVKLATFEAPVPGMDAMKWTEKLAEFPNMAPVPEGMGQHLKMLRQMHGEGGQPMRDVIIQRGHQGGPARISIMRMPQAVMLFRDDEGAVELKNEDGKQVLEVRDPQEKVLFAGDVSTPELREKLDARIKARLELVEARDTLEFVPQGQFEVEERDGVTAGALEAEKIHRRMGQARLGNPVTRL